MTPPGKQLVHCTSGLPRLVRHADVWLLAHPTAGRSLGEPGTIISSSARSTRENLVPGSVWNLTCRPGPGWRFHIGPPRRTLPRGTVWTCCSRVSVIAAAMPSVSTRFDRTRLETVAPLVRIPPSAALLATTLPDTSLVKLFRLAVPLHVSGRLQCGAFLHSLRRLEDCANLLHSRRECERFLWCHAFSLQ